jgi:hypothetical protein
VTLPEQLSRLADESPDVRDLLTAFALLEETYRESLEAMGLASRPSLTVGSSADVTITFTRDVVSSTTVAT